MKTDRYTKYHATELINGFVILFIVIAICYSNTLDASWHFDDYIHIVKNNNVHLDKLSLQSIKSSFYYFDDPGRLYRPMSGLSFALNWYFGADSVTGYHVVNIALHIITAFFLFLSIMILLKTPYINDLYKNNNYQIALLASVLWAIHPVQTQAVTYIVQRMAVLAAMFYIMAIFCFIKARLSEDKTQRYSFGGATVFLYFLSLLSKENAILLPCSLLLIEMIFFSPNKVSQIKKMFSPFGTAVLILMIVILSILSFKLSDNFRFIFEGYDLRPFDMKERLLAQQQIIIKYLLQIFHPLQSRFSIEHDIIISKSLIDPLATFPSSLINLALIVMALMKFKKWPLVSFAVLFFYLNNIVESTFIPLEMMFDHRNYLPSFFIFLPISSWLVIIIDNFKRKNRFFLSLIVLAFICLIMSVGTTTFVRNKSWANELILWGDVHHKYPELGRPYQIFAKYHKNLGNYDIATHLYNKAAFLKFPMPHYGKNLSFNNIGNIYMEKGQFEAAISYYQKARLASPRNQTTLYNLSSAYVRMGEFEKADRICNNLLNLYFNQPKNLNLKGFILLKTGKTDDAISFFEKALAIDPNDKNILINIGCAYLINNKHDQGNSFWQNAYTLYPSDINVLLGLIETCARAGTDHDNKILEYIDNLLNKFTINNIELAIYNFQHSNTMPTIRLLLATSEISKSIYILANKVESL